MHVRIILGPSIHRPSISTASAKLVECCQFLSIIFSHDSSISILSHDSNLTVSNQDSNIFQHLEGSNMTNAQVSGSIIAVFFTCVGTLILGSILAINADQHISRDALNMALKSCSVDHGGLASISVDRTYVTVYCHDKFITTFSKYNLGENNGSD